MSQTPARTAGQRLLPWFFMALEVTWLSAVYDLLNRAADSPLGGPPGLTCLFYPAAFLARKGIDRLNLPWTRTAALHLGLALAGAALLLKLILFPEQPWNPWGWSRATILESSYKGWALVLGYGFFAWLRGFFLAGRQVDFRGLAGAFQVGLGVLVVVLPLGGVLETGPPAWPLVAAFFAVSLSGLWLAGRSGAGAPPGGRTAWFILVGLSLVLVLGLGFAVWVLVDRELVELLIRPLVWLWHRFLDLMSFLSRLLPEPKPVPLPEMGGTAPRLADPGFKQMFIDLAWVRKVGEFAFVTASLIILGMALFRSLTDLLKWLRKRMGLDTGQVVSSSEYGFRDDIKALFRFLFHWLKKLLGFYKKGTKEIRLNPGAETVRGIYRRFLAWGRAKGMPRPPSATPYEYRDRIRPALPEREEDLGLLTETYVLVRYGREIPDPERIDLVQRAWRRIKTTTPVLPEEEEQP